MWGGACGFACVREQGVDRKLGLRAEVACMLPGIKDLWLWVLRIKIETRSECFCDCAWVHAQCACVQVYESFSKRWAGRWGCVQEWRTCCQGSRACGYGTEVQD
jgi:hypothetical protein